MSTTASRHESAQDRFEENAGIGSLAGAAVGALIGVGAAAGGLPVIAGAAATVGMATAGGTIAGTILGAIATSANDWKKGPGLTPHPAGPFGVRRRALS